MVSFHYLPWMGLLGVRRGVTRDEQMLLLDILAAAIAMVGGRGWLGWVIEYRFIHVSPWEGACI
jgi:hypothetical protein